MRSWLILVVALAGCDRVLGLERVCDEEQFGSTCATCGGLGQACCASATTCGDGLFCGDGTCSECVIDVAPGRRHMCSLRYDNTVWCSGQNESAQLARPAGEEKIAEPIQVLDANGQPFGDVVKLAAGRSHTCAVRRDGQVWCWGRNSQGQLGNGTNVLLSLVPAPVVVQNKTPLTNIVDVRAGYCHTCAIDTDGGVACWGCANSGELGDGTIIGRNYAAPVLTQGSGSPELTDVAELSVGHEHACARTTAGVAYCWGDNAYGQIGDDHTGGLAFVLAPYKVFDDATSIGAGSQFTCATRTDGSAWCWGRASGNRLGNGEDEAPADQDIPTRVVVDFAGTPFAGATRVSVGTVGCLLDADTSMSCWGNDLYGTTGGGGSVVPAPVVDRDGQQLTGVDRIVGHYAHTCAHQTSGRHVCWGRNTSGELANGTFTHAETPATVQLTCP